MHACQFPFKVGKTKISLLELCLDIVNEFFINKKYIPNQYQLLFSFIENKIEPELDSYVIDWLTDKVYSFWMYRKENSSDNFRKTINLPTNEASQVQLKELLSRYSLTKSKLCKNNLAKWNNGYNIWIMKPTDKSKGIGIEVKHSLNAIMKTVISNQEKYIVQKYIERPLLYFQRKFDIRVWILLVNTNPLVA